MIDEKVHLWFNESECIDLLRYLPPDHISRDMIVKAGCNIYNWTIKNKQIFNNEMQHIANL